MHWHSEPALPPQRSANGMLRHSAFSPWSLALRAGKAGKRMIRLARIPANMGCLHFVQVCLLNVGG